MFYVLAVGFLGNLILLGCMQWKPNVGMICLVKWGLIKLYTL